MKRKKAMAFNATGATINFIGAENANRLQNGLFAGGISLGETYTDNGLTFGQKMGCRQYLDLCTSRRWFELPVDYDEDDCFTLGRQFNDGCISRRAFYFGGYRCVAEYFDTNVVIDVQGCLDEDFDIGKDKTIQLLVARLSKKYRAERCPGNENLVMVYQYE